MSGVFCGWKTRAQGESMAKNSSTYTKPFGGSTWKTLEKHIISKKIKLWLGVFWVFCLWEATAMVIFRTSWYQVLCVRQVFLEQYIKPGKRGARPGIVREGELVTMFAEHLWSSWGDPPKQGLRVLNYLATIGWMNCSLTKRKNLRNNMLCIKLYLYMHRLYYIHANHTSLLYRYPTL